MSETDYVPSRTDIKQSSSHPSKRCLFLKTSHPSQVCPLYVFAVSSLSNTRLHRLPKVFLRSRRTSAPFYLLFSYFTFPDESKLRITLLFANIICLASSLSVPAQIPLCVRFCGSNRFEQLHHLLWRLGCTKWRVVPVYSTSWSIRVANFPR